MESGGGGRDDFHGFGHPFAGFGGFGRPGSQFPGFFGGRDPFDDPFFRDPVRSLRGPSMFGPSLFGPGGGMFSEFNEAGFLDQAPPPTSSRGPVIRELSDGEGDDGENNKEPLVQEPDEEVEEKRSNNLQQWNNFNMGSSGHNQARTYSFQSSSVTYGGLGGAYYTSSTTKRTGNDGITVEESKEADTTTGRATHRISRGIQDKGHSVTRRLNSDGRVDSTQTLHNLNEGELVGFEEAWKGNAMQHLPMWNHGFNDGNAGWALPATQEAQRSGSSGSSSRRRKRVIPIS